jgi:hypothetical protein
LQEKQLQFKTVYSITSGYEGSNQLHLQDFTCELSSNKYTGFLGPPIYWRPLGRTASGSAVLCCKALTDFRAATAKLISADYSHLLVDFYTLMMEAICSSETYVYTISTRCHIPDDDILHSHRRENLKLPFVLMIILNT